MDIQNIMSKLSKMEEIVNSLENDIRFINENDKLTEDDHILIETHLGSALSYLNMAQEVSDKYYE